LETNGIRSQIIALVAAAIEPGAFSDVESQNSMKSFSYGYVDGLTAAVHFSHADGWPTKQTLCRLIQKQMGHLNIHKGNDDVSHKMCDDALLPVQTTLSGAAELLDRYIG
jgi:hypothetical protein